jgi:hypothetical protein
LILKPFQGFGAAFLYAFALSGRWFVCALPTQGAAALALGYAVLRFQRGVIRHSIYQFTS